MVTRTATLSGHANKLGAIAVSADGRVLVSTASDMTIRVWETATWSLRHAISDMDRGTRQPVVELDISPCGRFLATGVVDFTTKVYSLESGTRLKRLHPEKKSSFNSAEQIRFSPAGDLLASAKGKTIELFATEDYSKAGELTGHTSKVHLMEWSRDGRTLISCGGKFVKLWDVASRADRAELTRHTRLIGSLAVARDGHFFVTGGEDGRVFVWSLPEAREEGEYRGHTKQVFHLAISSDGRAVASWDMNRELHVWDRATGGRKHCLTDVWGSPAFLPNSSYLILNRPATGAVVVDTISGDIVHTVPASELLAVAPDGSWFASDEDNQVAIWSRNRPTAASQAS